MTIYSALRGDLRRDRPPKNEARYFSTDEHTKVLAYCSWQADRIRAPTVVLLHGLTGDADEGFVCGTAQKAFALGFNTIRLNTRNCGGTTQLSPTVYHMGLTVDLQSVLTELGEIDGLKRIYFGGFSMGANVSLKLAGDWGEAAPSFVKAVFAVSPPLEVARASRAISRGVLNRCYEFKFLMKLKAMIREKNQSHPSLYSCARLKSIRSIRAFDDAFVAPCFGFRDADDYYEKASANQVVDAITLPTLVIHAEDDTLVPKISVMAWRARAMENVQFLITKEGGHVGFIAARPLGGDQDCFWAENRIVEFLQACEKAHFDSSSEN
jgi:predicted alpha/beta-fold hydrolase